MITHTHKLPSRMGFAPLTDEDIAIMRASAGRRAMMALGIAEQARAYRGEPMTRS